jgi:hypothetical protein
MSLLIDCENLVNQFDPDDQLIQVIKSTIGPLHQYAKTGQKVFVFARLMELLKQTKIMELPEDQRHAVVASAFQDSHVSAEVAVDQYGIVPVPYTVKKGIQDYFIIQEPFCAAIPARYESKAALNDALVALLCENVIEGDDMEVDFAFCGQSFRLTHSFNPNDLPKEPGCVWSLL